MITKKVHIIGFGKSGTAAAELLLANGWEIIISDDNENSSLLEKKTRFESLSCKVLLGNHKEALREDVDLTVVSPGIRLDSEVVVKRRNQGVRLIGEMELGWEYLNGEVAAITGSNGKSTVTALLGQIFSNTGRSAFTAGNIGLPVCDIALKTDEYSLISLEVSSFQLMSIETFQPHVSIITNVTPDHIDWHGGYENYKRAKANLWSNQTKHDWIVYNADDNVTRDLIVTANSLRFPFSTNRSLHQGAFISDDKMHFANLPGSDGNKNVELDLDIVKIPGKHNQANALAAISAALIFGITTEVISKAVSEFKGLPHRLEFVRELDGVDYINDSKATNTDSGRVALEAMTKPVVLIAGGRGKGDGYSKLIPTARGKVKKLVLIGEEARQIEDDLGKLAPVVHRKTLADAINEARKNSQDGDVVLFSPLATSFDMFANFEDRGDQFRDIVMELV